MAASILSALLVFHAFQCEQLVACQAIEVGYILDITRTHQLLAHLFTDSIDVHGASRDKMNDAFQVAGGTLLVRTVGHGLVCNADDGSIAQRTAFG